MIAHLSQAQMCVDWACPILGRAGWTLEYDPIAKMWDVETPDGWQTAKNGLELVAIARRALRTPAEPTKSPASVCYTSVTIRR